MGSSSRGDWKKITTQPGSVCMGVCVCVDQQCWSQRTHTHSCTHPGQQVAPQPLTRTNIWQLPHRASSCRMLPAAAVLPLLLFVFWSMLSTSLCLCLCLLLLSAGLGAFNDFWLISRKKANRAKKNEAKTKATKRKWAKKSSNFAGSNKSQVAFAKNNKIYTDIHISFIYVYKTVQHMLLIAMENIFLFMKTKRGVAQQSKHTFLSTWNTQHVCKKRVRYRRARGMGR